MERKKKLYQSNSLYPGKLFFRNENKIYIFSDEKKNFQD